VLPYFGWNYAQTGHPLPISGRVKTIQTRHALEQKGIDRFSPTFLPRVINDSRYPISLFVSGAMTDALWPLGSRIVFSRDRGVGMVVFVPIGLCLAVVWFVRRQADGRRLLIDHYRRLAPFVPLAVYALVNAFVSVWLYPSQIRYAITQWWLVESELLMIVGVAVLVAVTLEHAGGFAGAPHRRQWFLRLALVAALAFHATQTVRFYWDGRYNVRNWNASWNDHSFRAARWLAANAPRDARVGSWNAGVLGYYSTQPVVNLDGLINSDELVPYLADRRTADYVRSKGLRFLSDADGAFESAGVLQSLKVREVYSEYMPLMEQHYRIYEVLHE